MSEILPASAPSKTPNNGADGLKMSLRSYCALEIEPVVAILPSPYRHAVVDWRVTDKTALGESGQDSGAIEHALKHISRQFGEFKSDYDCKLVALQLIAKTSRRTMSPEMEVLVAAEIIKVLLDFPERICRAVVDDWDRRPGDEGIFTPCAAVLRRALEAEAMPYNSLVKALRREIIGK